MKQNMAIDLLKVFISDKIQQRRGEVASLYNSAEEQGEQLEELRQLEVTSQIKKSVFNYAKWYSGNNEIAVLEIILCKLKEIEEKTGEQVKTDNENKYTK